MKLETILSIVEKTTSKNLRTKSRTRSLVESRAIYYKLAREYTSSSLAKIAKVVSRDHATALHSIRNVDVWAKHSKQLRKDIQKCTVALESSLSEDDKTFLTYEELVKKYADLKDNYFQLENFNSELIKENKQLEKENKKYRSEQYA